MIRAELPPRPIRVLHLTISFARGGRRDAILTLARAGRDHGIASHLATLRGSADDTTPFADAFDSVVDLAVRGRPSLRQLHALRDHCRALGIQVVHAHDASSQFVASLLRCVAPTLQVVMTFHRSLGFESAGWRNRFRNAISLTLVGRVLTASAERRGHFLAENLVRGAKVETIPLGIDFERFRPDEGARAAVRAELGVAPDERLVVTAGHYGEEKGVDLAIRAVAAAAADPATPPLRHVVMGTGTPEQVEAMRVLVRESWGGAETAGREPARLLGQRSDPERVLAAADLVVHLPRLEAFGLVVVQAMACGAPVVASAVGGLPEIVVEGETGHLVAPGDPAAVGAVIGALLGDPARLANLARGGLARAREEYPAGRYAERHRALYERLIARR